MQALGWEPQVLSLPAEDLMSTKELHLKEKAEILQVHRETTEPECKMQVSSVTFHYISCSEKFHKGHPWKQMKSRECSVGPCGGRAE